MIKLSVVIPVYNGENFIIKSYNSIINQNIEDFEILYVNNNSSDNSLSEIEKLVSKDHRVKVLEQSKPGAAAARNKGITNSKGEYVYVFDVDDEIYPQALLKMIEVLDNYPEQYAVFGKLVKSSKSILETSKPSGETFKVRLEKSPFWGLTWFEDLSQVVGPPGFLYRKTVFKDIGMYNESIKNNEDTAFDIKLGMTKNVAFIDMYIYLYFKHENSTIETSKRSMSRAFMIWPRLVYEHIPFYLNQKVPEKFKDLLSSQLFKSMGRQIQTTKGNSKRRALNKKLLSEASGIKIPNIIRIYLSILVILPLNVALKFYLYYLVPYVVKRNDI